MNQRHLISCSAKELREVRNYIRQLEKDHHNLRARHERQRQARALRLARAIREIPRSPLRSLAECARIVFGKRFANAAKVSALRPKKFACLERRSQSTIAAMDGSVHRTALADIAATCMGPEVLTLKGVGPQRLGSSATSAWHEVSPHDFEIAVHTTDMPWLLIEPTQVSSSSPWAGVFEVDDMAINLALANLIELVKERRGRVIFTRWSTTPPPPLFADFAAQSEQVDDMLTVLKNGRST